MVQTLATATSDWHQEENAIFVVSRSYFLAGLENGWIGSGP